MELAELPSWEIHREKGSYVWKSVEPGQESHPTVPASTTHPGGPSREALRSYSEASAAHWAAVQACTAQGGWGDGAAALWAAQEQAFAELARQRDLLAPFYPVDGRREAPPPSPQMVLQRQHGQVVWRESAPP